VKLGCSSWSYHAAIRAGRLDQLEWLRLCAEELELDGVELLDLHFPSLDRDYLRDVKRRCAELQLTVSCASVSNDFGLADAEARAKQVERVNQWVDVAAFLGAPVLRVFSGWLPRDAALESKERCWPPMIDGLRRCADYAAQQGVMLGLENHNGRGLTGTADEVERCLREVASPWLRLNLDTGDYGDLEPIRRTLPHAVHIHAKLYELDGAGADRREDWPAILRILSGGGYRGFLSIEYEGEEEPVAAVARGARYLRRLLREA
jgi:sugar phosphate isomerase/epimerase